MIPENLCVCVQSAGDLADVNIAEQGMAAVGLFWTLTW